MKKRSVNFLYAVLEDAIKKIGSYPLEKPVMLNYLGDTSKTKAVTQRCYNEIARDNLDIPAMDYLFVVSTLYLLGITEKTLKIPKGEIHLIDFVGQMLLHCLPYHEEMKNFLRYFMKNPLFFLSKVADYAVVSGSADEMEEERLKCFQLISSFWYIIMMSEKVGKDIKPDVAKLLSFVKS